MKNAVEEPKSNRMRKMIGWQLISIGLEQINQNKTNAMKKNNTFMIIMT
ncbi:hypothetical protein [Paenibacillus polymyxa]|nr:hypothetical protein [Paenibacillus polymyxa]WCM59091.1 hypothetical protein OYT09_13625 [Paenibacillus polymyxa]